MYFDLNDEQQQIKRTAREFLASRYKPERIRELTETDLGFEESDWQEMVELGWPGLALPEEHGGQGLGIVELATVFEEMGYGLPPSPLLSNTVAGLALATCGTDQQQAEFLAPLAAGEKRGTVALFDAGSSAVIGEFEMEAQAGDGGVMLDGEKVLVMDADAADFLLVATSDGRRHIVDTDQSGVSVTQEPSIDLTRRVYSVRFDGVEVPADKIASGVRGDPGSTVIEKRDEMRRNKLMADIAADIPPPSPAQVRDYYKQHQADFRTEDEVHVRQILLRDSSVADEIAAKLKTGASFEQLSMDHSLAANAKKGGDIGYVSRGELPKVFEDEIFALKPGQVTRVIQTDSMFHIFKVDDRRGPGIVDFPTADPVIQQRLKEEAMRSRFEELVARTRRDIQAAVLTKRLPFNYSGALPRSTNE